jgi:hypothetical protein
MSSPKRPVMLNLFQHPWHPFLYLRALRGTLPWMLKQVQHDDRLVEG